MSEFAATLTVIGTEIPGVLSEDKSQHRASAQSIVRIDINGTKCYRVSEARRISCSTMQKWIA